MRGLNLVKAELTMLYGELKQYWLNYLFYNIGMIVMFVGLFYSIGENKNEDGLVLLIGLVIWQVSSSAIGYLGYVIQDEAMLGTLEQIFMTRTSIFLIFFSKVLVNCLFNIIKALIIFGVCVFVFGIQNVIGEISILGTFLCILIFISVTVTFYIVGLFFGGLALFFKRVSNVIQLISYLLLFFTNITISISELPACIRVISAGVPIRWAMDIIRSIIYDIAINPKDIFGFIISSISYFIIGISVFLYCISIAKRDGKLAGY